MTRIYMRNGITNTDMWFDFPYDVFEYERVTDKYMKDNPKDYYTSEELVEAYKKYKEKV